MGTQEVPVGGLGVAGVCSSEPAPALFGWLGLAVPGFGLSAFSLGNEPCGKEPGSVKRAGTDGKIVMIEEPSEGTAVGSYVTTIVFVVFVWLQL